MRCDREWGDEMSDWMKYLKTTVAILVLLVVVTASVTVTSAGSRLTPKSNPVVEPPPVELPTIQASTFWGGRFNNFMLWLSTLFV